MLNQLSDTDDPDSHTTKRTQDVTPETEVAAASSSSSSLPVEEYQDKTPETETGVASSSSSLLPVEENMEKKEISGNSNFSI